MQSVEVSVELDLPEGVELVEYCRMEQGHGFHVRWTPNEAFHCNRCGHVEATVPEAKNTFYTVRDLDLWGQPTFLVHQPLLHCCSRCGHRQHLVPPFKRKDTQYSFRFERDVLRRLRGSTATAVAHDLGIDPGTVEAIADQQIADAQAKQVDPTRTITDVGIDEISLRKGHRLYVTLLWDLSQAKPELLAAAQGRDEAAVRACAEKLSEKQRLEVKTVRSDMGAAMLTATKYFRNAQSVIDRFHVAKRVGEFADGLRKKITQQYKQRLSKEERKQFRSQMWLFRRRWDDLDEQQQATLDGLFDELPDLGQVYWLREELAQIFDQAPDRSTAAQRLDAWCTDAAAAPEDWSPVLSCLAEHRAGILAYFDERKTSGVVEGLNNKARVILKRCYGLKSLDTFWTRLVVEFAAFVECSQRTVAELRTLAHTIRASFCRAYT